MRPHSTSAITRAALPTSHLRAAMLGWTAPLHQVGRLVTKSGVRFGQQEVDMTITVNRTGFGEERFSGSRNRRARSCGPSSEDRAIGCIATLFQAYAGPRWNGSMSHF